VTNIPATGGIPGVPGSHHAQFTDVLHRSRATVEAMGLRNLSSKTWTVNCGWVLAANIAADLSAWCRLPGLYDHEDSRTPSRIRCVLAVGTACPPGAPRPRPRAEDQPDLALEGRLPDLLAAAVRPAGIRLTSHPLPANPGRSPPRRGRSRCRPEHIGQRRHPPETCEPDTTAENRRNTISNQPRQRPESSRSTTIFSSARPGNCLQQARGTGTVHPVPAYPAKLSRLHQHADAARRSRQTRCHPPR
jgi:hypothetical protein